MGQRLRKSIVQIRRVLDANSRMPIAAGLYLGCLQMRLRSSSQGFDGFVISSMASRKYFAGM